MLQNSWKAICLFILLSSRCFGQDSLALRKGYEDAHVFLKALIAGKNSATFKDAVFAVENASQQNKLTKEEFQNHIRFLAMLSREYAARMVLPKYRHPDSVNFKKNVAIYRILKDSVQVVLNAASKFKTIPFAYDFNDFWGQETWSNMFVSKLLLTHKGNCHSMPYLYKILADELGATCWLSTSPNHMYIKNRSKSLGWYNTELTSGTFPIDAWIMASGYLPLQAIQNGIYMDTLSNTQSIALCIHDLAKGYEHQTKNYEDGFILKCCDLSLQYFPKNVQAMLLKAETLKHIYEKQEAAKMADAAKTYQQMEALYIKLLDLGYREMPEKMYLDWLQSVNSQKEKFQNKQLKQQQLSGKR
jgi:hypothetical protein